MRCARTFCLIPALAMKYQSVNQNFKQGFGTIFWSKAWTKAEDFTGGLVVQAVSRSVLTARVLSSRFCHSTWISYWTKRGLGRVFSGFLPFFPNLKHHYRISLLSTHSFHLINPCDGATGVVGPTLFPRNTNSMKSMDEMKFCQYFYLILLGCLR